MSVYADVLTAVVDLINGLNPYSTVTVGPLPPNNGISIAWTTSANNIFFDKFSSVEMTAMLNGKNTDQQTVLNGLSQIHTGITLQKTFPSAENFQITDISTSTAPTYMGREENKQWLYGSSLRVKFYLRGN